MTKTNLECALFKAGGTKVRNTLISYALRYR